jgi:predicted small lipoprotein YifL
MAKRDKRSERTVKVQVKGARTMGSALRALLIIALVLGVGLSACGRRGSLERPKPSYPETKADPSTKMSQAPDRRLWIDRLIQ